MFRCVFFPQKRDLYTSKRVVLCYFQIHESAPFQRLGFFFRWIGIGKFWLLTTLSFFGVSFTSQVHPNVHSVFGEKITIVSQNFFNCLFFSFYWQCISPIKEFKLINLISRVFLWVEFFSFISSNSLTNRVCIGVDPQFYHVFQVSETKMCCYHVFQVSENKVLFCCSGLFVLRSSFN